MPLRALVVLLIIALLSPLLAASGEPQDKTKVSTMTHGGTRPGAGRKPKFDDRSSIHVYIEEGQRQQFLSMIKYMKEAKEDRSIPASDTLLDIAQQWMAAIPEDRYLAWAANYQPWFKENYPQEYQRVRTKLQQKKAEQSG